MTIVSIGIRREAERHLITLAGQDRALRRIAGGEHCETVFRIERVCESQTPPALEDIAHPPPPRDETPTEIIYLEPYRK